MEIKTVEDAFEADKIQAAIEYLECKGVLNEIKAQAIEDAIEYVDSNKTMMHETRDLLEQCVNKLRGDW
jgi:hypothetical protein